MFGRSLEEDIAVIGECRAVTRRRRRRTLDTFMALFPRGGGAHSTSSAAAVAASASAGMSHLYPPRIAWDGDT